MKGWAQPGMTVSSRRSQEELLESWGQGHILSSLHTLHLSPWISE